MEISSSSLRKFFGEKGRDIIYGSLLALFLGAGAIVFIWSVTFLAKTINMVVGKAIAGDIVPATIDLVKFSTIASRLNISFTFPRPGVPPPSPPPEQEPAPPAAEAPPEPDLSQIKVRILNGTTVTGLAKTWEGYFKNEGFSSISIGNAAQRDYTGVTIQYKSSAAGTLEKIKEVLAQHGAGISQESEVEESEQYDISLIIGK